MKRTKVAVVGVGNMGQHHARIYSRLKGVKLVAVCDVDEKRGREIASKHKVLFFKNYKDLFSFKKKIDAVSIVVPTKLHKDIACSFLKRGIHVLLEKPIADTLVSGKEIVEAARKSKAIISVGHVERFNPAVIALENVINQNKLGRIISITARRVGVFPPNVKDANVFLDLAIHDIDIISRLIKQEPIKIYKHSIKTHTTTQEDAGEIFLVYKNAAAFIQVNWITPVKIRTLSVTGTNGYAELDYISQTLVLHNAKIEKKINSFSEFLKFSNPKIEKIKVIKTEPLKMELQSFINHIANSNSPIVSAEEALRDLEICLRKL